MKKLFLTLTFLLLMVQIIAVSAKEIEFPSNFDANENMNEDAPYSLGEKKQPTFNIWSVIAIVIVAVIAIYACLLIYAHWSE